MRRAVRHVSQTEATAEAHKLSYMKFGGIRTRNYERVNEQIKFNGLHGRHGTLPG